MKLFLAKKLHNGDEVLVKKSCLSTKTEILAQVLVSRRAKIEQKDILLFDVLLPNGSILVDIPHNFLS